jgi:hypothetical protein
MKMHLTGEASLRYPGGAEIFRRTRRDFWKGAWLSQKRPGEFVIRPASPCD